MRKVLQQIPAGRAARLGSVQFPAQRAAGEPPRHRTVRRAHLARPEGQGHPVPLRVPGGAEERRLARRDRYGCPSSPDAGGWRSGSISTWRLKQASQRTTHSSPPGQRSVQSDPLGEPQCTGSPAHTTRPHPVQVLSSPKNTRSIAEAPGGGYTPLEQSLRRRLALVGGHEAA